MKYDDQGREIPDATPVEVPLRLRNRPEEVERLRSLIRNELSDQAAKQGFETFEEANDFDVDEDEFFPVSPHETAPDDEQFREFAEGVKLDMKGKREYLRRRRGHSDREHDEGEPMYGRRKGDVEAHPGRGRSRGARRSDPEQRPAHQGHQQRTHAGRHADAEQRRVRPYRDTATGEVIDPRDFDDSD